MWIKDYLTAREGIVWTPVDTAEVMRVIAEIERLATELRERVGQVKA